MVAQALYLKYRPQTFEEVVGQEPIMRTLRNALRQDRIRHAYLFAGPRGTGKTTTARLLAKAVNCQAPEGKTKEGKTKGTKEGKTEGTKEGKTEGTKGEGGRPCNECPICIAVNEGRLLDLIEIDAASNRGIDEIRDIREKVGFRPNQGRFKVYVLDEAHMLTEPAFNALLKTLEEPPPHVIFVLVTTDPHKIPATISSRCQRFDFRRIPLQAIADRLTYIAQEEGVTIEPAALELIAHQGTGAMRDAISLLDQLTSYGDEIRLDQVQMVLGTVTGEAAGKLATAVADGDVAGGLELINQAVGDGADPRQFGREVVAYLRGLLLVKEGTGTQLLNATAEQAEEMEALAARMETEQLLRATRLFNDAVTDVKGGLQVIPQLPLEMALVESILEPATPEAATVPRKVQDPPPVASPSKPAAQAKKETRRIAEQPAPTPTPAPPEDAEPETAATTEPSPGPQASAEHLSLGQVEDGWHRVLQVVRHRNPMTQGLLNTGCRPVDVRGNEIFIAFPYRFLQEKLGDPQRTMEIQDALNEVFGTNCRLKLVKESEYTPGQQAPSVSQPPTTEQTAPEPPLDEQALDKISQWAEERGGQAKVIES
jgi:DNA polymerase-3 subunit gamma/tau